MSRWAWYAAAYGRAREARAVGQSRNGPLLPGPFTDTSSVGGPFGDTEIRVRPMGKGKSAARHTVPSDERTGYFSFARRRDVVPIAWKRSGPQLFLQLTSEGRAPTCPGRAFTCSVKPASYDRFSPVSDGYRFGRGFGHWLRPPGSGCGTPRGPRAIVRRKRTRIQLVTAAELSPPTSPRTPCMRSASRQINQCFPSAMTYGGAYGCCWNAASVASR